MIRLSEAKKGQKLTIKKIIESDIKNKLMELCFVPNEMLSIEKIAPLGDPFIIKISDYLVSIRKQEAEHIWVEILENE